MTAPKGMFAFLRTRGEELVTRVSNELMSNPQFLQAMQTAYRGKARIDGAVGQALRTMNVPSRTEFKRALARIEALEQELAQQKRQKAASPVKPRPVAAGEAKKAPARARQKPAKKTPKAPITPIE